MGRMLRTMAALLGWWGCGAAQAGPSIPFAEALDTPGRSWTLSPPGQWTGVFSGSAKAGGDVVESAGYAPDGALSEGTLSTEIAGPATVSFWFNIVYAPTDPALEVGVDGEYVNLMPLDNQRDRWEEVRVQIPAGSHTLAFRSPYLKVYIDRVVVEPGRTLVGSQVGLDIPWVVQLPGAFADDPDSPPGASTGSVTLTGAAGQSYWRGIFPPGQVSGWIKMLSGPEATLYVSNSPGWWGSAYRAESDWQRFSGVSAPGSAAIDFFLQDWDGSPTQRPLGLKLGGLSVSPNGLGEALDAPEFEWTMPGPEFWQSGAAEDMIPRHTGSLFAELPGSVGNPMVQTEMTGPGTLFFSGYFFAPTGTPFWRVSIDGLATDIAKEGNPIWAYGRYSVPIPAGTHTVGLGAALTPFDPLPPDNDPIFRLDDVTFAVPMAGAALDALDHAGGAAPLVRQATAGLWSRDTTVSHDGVDSLALAAGSPPRRADLVIPFEGAPLMGFWLKREPGLPLHLTLPVGSYAYLTQFSLAAPHDEGWHWVPIAPDGATDAHLSVLQSQDSGQALWIDEFRRFSCPASPSDALGTPGRTWTDLSGGVRPLELPGSDAVGQKALLLASPGGDSADQLKTQLTGASLIRLRHHFLPNDGYGIVRVRGSLYSADDLDRPLQRPSPPESEEWLEEDLYYFGSSPSAELEIRAQAGSWLVDEVEILPMTPTTVAEGLDAPWVAPTRNEGWTALTGAGVDAGDAVVAPGSSPFDRRWLEIPSPQPAAGADVSFKKWTSRTLNWAGYQMNFLAGETPGHVFNLPLELRSTWGFFYAGEETWQSVRLHHDDPPPSIAFWLNPDGPEALGGVMLDAFSWVPTPVGAYGAALDTLEPEGNGRLPAAGTPGWTSWGQAWVTVDTAMTQHGGDALKIARDPTEAGDQAAHFFAQVGDAVWEVRFWARGSGNGESVALFVEGQEVYRSPLAAMWTEHRVRIPWGGSPQALRVSAVLTEAPESAVYLDHFSTRVDFDPAVDVGDLLEAPAAAFTVAGSHPWQVSSMASVYLPDYPAGPAIVDGIAPAQDVPVGGWVSASTTVTGPGTIVSDVATQWASPSTDWDVNLSVDGVAVQLERALTGRHVLQTAVGPGSHVVEWRMDRKADSPYSPPALLSVKFVPAPAAEELSAALGEVFAGQSWTVGGTHPPGLSYRLTEGLCTVEGALFPAVSSPDTSWIQSSVEGPCDVLCDWRSAGKAWAYVAEVDGKNAAHLSVANRNWTAVQIPAARMTLHLGPGPHTVRILGVAQDTPAAELAGFGVVPTLNPGNPSGIVWVSGAVEYDDEGPFADWGASDGIQFLKGKNLSVGSFFATGPAVVRFDVMRTLSTPLQIIWRQETGEGGSAFSTGGPDVGWLPEGVILPPGEHYVTFINYGQNGELNEPHIFLRNLAVIPDTAYAAWAASHQLTGEAALFGVDGDSDGTGNIMEFAFGTDPAHPDAPPSPAVVAGTGDSPLSLLFPRLPHGVGSLHYVIETSIDLENWSTFTSVTPNAPGQPGPVITLPAHPAGRSYFRVIVAW